MSAKGSRITSSFKTTKGVPSQNQKEDVKASTSNTIVDDDLKLLKDFDLNWEFGPSMGITRMERWHRAEKHGLNPSPRVKQVIEANLSDEKYTQCLWNDYKIM